LVLRSTIHTSIRPIKLVGHVSVQHFPVSPPRNTPFLWSSPLILPNGISISSAVVVWVPNAQLYNALSVGKKTPKIAPSHWDFGTRLEDRTTAIGNMHKNGKDHTCGLADILRDRQTHAQTYSLQYFATTPAGKVKMTGQHFIKL